MRTEAAKYLKRQGHCFNLFGPAPRFLQAAKLKPMNEDAKPIPVEKLDLAAAAGASPTLFDNDGGTGRQFSCASLGVMLVTYQICSPGGLIGIARWNGIPTGENKSSRHGLGLRNSAVHGFLLASNLLATIHANLISKKTHSATAKLTESWGEPTWRSLRRVQRTRPRLHPISAGWFHTPGRFGSRTTAVTSFWQMGWTTNSTRRARGSPASRSCSKTKRKVSYVVGWTRPSGASCIRSLRAE